MRALVAVFLVAFLSWLGASAAIVYAAHRAAVERNLIVRVVCESVVIREMNRDPLAPVYRARYDALLAEVGESCPTERS